MVLLLASDRASFISGASIDIAGGMQGQIAYYPTLKREFNAAMQEWSHWRLRCGCSVAVLSCAGRLYVSQFQ